MLCHFHLVLCNIYKSKYSHMFIANRDWGIIVSTFLLNKEEQQN